MEQGDASVGPVTITTPGDRHFMITRLFNAPRVLAFGAWTKARYLCGSVTTTYSEGAQIMPS